MPRDHELQALGLHGACAISALLHANKVESKAIIARAVYTNHRALSVHCAPPQNYGGSSA